MSLGDLAVIVVAGAAARRPSSVGVDGVDGSGGVCNARACGQVFFPCPLSCPLTGTNKFLSKNKKAS